MISFIVPAHNEKAWIGGCIDAIRQAMDARREPYEIIVVDDASTDGTATVAKLHGADVILCVQHRQISATRNAGARRSRGDALFFVDADTLISASVVRAALNSVQSGAVGGGCVPRFDGRIPLGWKLVLPFVSAIIRVFGLPGGACQFCTRSAFEATAG